MIQLATAPTASRSLRSSPSEAKGTAFETRRSRTGHAWPFPSRYAARPAPQDGQKSNSSDSGS